MDTIHTPEKNEQMRQNIPPFSTREILYFYRDTKIQDNIPQLKDFIEEIHTLSSANITPERIFTLTNKYDFEKSLKDVIAKITEISGNYQQQMSIRNAITEIMLVLQTGASTIELGRIWETFQSSLFTLFTKIETNLNSQNFSKRLHSRSNEVIEYGLQFLKHPKKLTTFLANRVTQDPNTLSHFAKLALKESIQDHTKHFLVPLQAIASLNNKRNTLLNEMKNTRLEIDPETGFYDITQAQKAIDQTEKKASLEIEILDQELTFGKLLDIFVHEAHSHINSPEVIQKDLNSIQNTVGKTVEDISKTQDTQANSGMNTPFYVPELQTKVEENLSQDYNIPSEIQVTESPIILQEKFTPPSLQQNGGTLHTHEETNKEEEIDEIDISIDTIFGNEVPQTLTFHSETLKSNIELSELHYVAKGGAGTVYKTQLNGKTCIVKVSNQKTEEHFMTAGGLNIATKLNTHTINALQNIPTPRQHNWTKLMDTGVTPDGHIVEISEWIDIDSQYLSGEDYFGEDIINTTESHPHSVTKNISDASEKLASALENPQTCVLSPDGKEQVQILLGAQSQAVEVLSKKVQAIGDLHKMGIIHRDIKPHNILVNPSDGRIKIIDYGTFRHTNTQTTSPEVLDYFQKQIENKEAVGSPVYMPPEQFKGESSKAGDIHSLGIMIYQLATGVTPTFETPNMLQIVFKKSANKLPSALNVSNNIEEYCKKRDINTPAYNVYFPLAKLADTILAIQTQNSGIGTQQIHQALKLIAKSQKCIQSSLKNGTNIYKNPQALSQTKTFFEKLQVSSAQEGIIALKHLSDIEKIMKKSRNTDEQKNALYKLSKQIGDEKFQQLFSLYKNNFRAMYNPKLLAKLAEKNSIHSLDQLFSLLHKRENTTDLQLLNKDFWQEQGIETLEETFMFVEEIVNRFGKIQASSRPGTHSSIASKPSMPQQFLKKMPRRSLAQLKMSA